MLLAGAIVNPGQSWVQDRHDLARGKQTVPNNFNTRTTDMLLSDSSLRPPIQVRHFFMLENTR